MPYQYIFINLTQEKPELTFFNIFTANIEDLTKGTITEDK